MQPQDTTAPSRSQHPGIFGEPKRCQHDYLADTIVINA